MHKNFPYHYHLNGTAAGRETVLDDVRTWTIETCVNN